MGAIVIIAGVAWLVYKSLKEEVFTQQVPPNTDYRQAYIDMNSGKYSAKEVDKRMNQGCYVKKEK